MWWVAVIGQQRVVHGPAAWALPWSLLEMQDLRPHSRCTEWGSAFLYLCQTWLIYHSTVVLISSNLQSVHGCLPRPFQIYLTSFFYIWRNCGPETFRNSPTSAWRVGDKAGNTGQATTHLSRVCYPYNINPYRLSEHTHAYPALRWSLCWCGPFRNYLGQQWIGGRLG